jgi:O-antigen ligase
VRALPANLGSSVLVGGGAGAAALAGYALVEMDATAAFAVSALPMIAVAIVYVMTSGQAALYAAAVALPMSTFIGGQVVGQLFYQDVIVLLALGALIFATFIGRGRVPPIPHTPVLGWPFVLFAAAIFSATLRGHHAYGTSLIGQPLRLFLYGAIIAGLAGMTVPRMYRLLPLLFYPGVIFIALVALYYLATGGSATDQGDLSTGGTRLVGITSSLYAAGALFLALLKTRLASQTRARMTHLSVAVVAMFCVVAGFGRAVYAAVAVVGLLFFITSRGIRHTVLSMAPLALPFLVVLAIVVNQAAPEFVASAGDRMLSKPATDANVQWRIEANRAVLEQVREQPLFGVGFGRGSEFFIEVEHPTTGLPSLRRVEIGQDPHNGYMFLLAGGGIVVLGTFALLLATFAVDGVRRYRSNADPRARLIIVWASATLFAFLVNAASGTSFGRPDNILTVWALLVLPAVVRPSKVGDSELVETSNAGDDSPDRGRADVNLQTMSW